jgi:hypothetical protein
MYLLYIKPCKHRQYILCTSGKYFALYLVLQNLSDDLTVAKGKKVGFLPRRKLDTVAHDKKKNYRKLSVRDNNSVSQSIKKLE